MKIKVLKNFGLGGCNLPVGTVAEIDADQFGDNIQTFKNDGFFEEVIDKVVEEVVPAAPKKAKVEAVS